MAFKIYFMESQQFNDLCLIPVSSVNSEPSCMKGAVLLIDWLYLVMLHR